LRNFTDGLFVWVFFRQIPHFSVKCFVFLARQIALLMPFLVDGSGIIVFSFSQIFGYGVFQCLQIQQRGAHLFFNIGYHKVVASLYSSIFMAVYKINSMSSLKVHFFLHMRFIVIMFFCSLPSSPSFLDIAHGVFISDVAYRTLKVSLCLSRRNLLILDMNSG
jgi:hypothetical protein